MLELAVISDWLFLFLVSVARCGGGIAAVGRLRSRRDSAVLQDRLSELQRADDLPRRGCQLRPVIQPRLLRCGQLVDLHLPVNLHYEKGASAHDGILGRMQSLQNGSNTLKQRCRDLRVLDLVSDSVRLMQAS